MRTATERSGRGEERRRETTRQIVYADTVGENRLWWEKYSRCITLGSRAVSFTLALRGSFFDPLLLPNSCERSSHQAQWGGSHLLGSMGVSVERPSGLSPQRSVRSWYSSGIHVVCGVVYSRRISSIFVLLQEDRREFDRKSCSVAPLGFLPQLAKRPAPPNFGGVRALSSLSANNILSPLLNELEVHIFFRLPRRHLEDTPKNTEECHDRRRWVGQTYQATG